MRRSGILRGRLCGGVRAGDLVRVCGRRRESVRNGHCQCFAVARKRSFPRNVRMFVDYLVTSTPRVGYGDLYKGRAEVVSGGRDQLSNDVRSALPHDKAEQPLPRLDSHRRPDNNLTVPARFSAGGCTTMGSGGIAEAHGMVSPWCMTLGKVLGSSRWRPAPDQPCRGAN